MRMIFIIIAVAICVSGCSPQKLQNNAIYAENNVITVSTLKSNKERAEIIRKTVLTINGVENATVVITGRTALVGIKTENNTLEEVQRLKELAEDVVKITDSDIKNVAISANDGIYDRIKTME